MILCEGNTPPVTFAAYRREVFDVSGAGDTVLAVLGAVLGSGHDLKKAASLANLAASLVVARRGTAVVSPGELLVAISELAGQNTQSKIMSLPQMASQAAEWREQKLVVGLTNGCFDLLHPGHIASITAAKQQCDRLIIALNSDSSVKRLKGESRPIQSQLARAVVLSALANVDGVVIFDEDAPLAVLDAMKPDIYCKGEDYRDKKIAEFDLVESYGGRIYLIPMVPGFSTTSTVAQMAA
jgi:D-beta-D-heptose 7-phosphate kinase/D-beta-D-heptose 1-phosphate adenosyltransferase